jgi:hypothetical protein
VSGIYWKLAIIPMDSIMKLGRTNCPSDKIHHVTVIIPYVWGISEKFRCFGSHFDVRATFKSKHVLCGSYEKASRRSNACTGFHATVADIMSGKQADLQKYTFRSTNT